jgi:hypothetical protein
MDTMYVANDSGPGPGKVAVQKWNLVGGTWTQNTSFVVALPTGDTASAAVRGLTAWMTGGGVTVVATTSESAPRLVRFFDPTPTIPGAATVTATPIATAATKTVYRGVALSPVP